jgi:hypothetical protein
LPYANSHHGNRSSPDGTVHGDLLRLPSHGGNSFPEDGNGPGIGFILRSTVVQRQRSRRDEPVGRPAGGERAQRAPSGYVTVTNPSSSRPESTVTGRQRYSV